MFEGVCVGGGEGRSVQIHAHCAIHCCAVRSARRTAQQYVSQLRFEVASTARSGGGGSPVILETGM